MTDSSSKDISVRLPRRFLAKDALSKHNTPKRTVKQHIPETLLENAELNQSIQALPQNYNFEIYKTIWRLQQAKAKRVGLQFPEGLLMYGCILSNILTRFADLEHCFILGDATYGACCIDDFTARALQCDFLVHYGHSCLVPVDVTTLPCLYIFVTIEMDTKRFIQTLKANLSSDLRLAIAGTIQFMPSIHVKPPNVAFSYFVGCQRAKEALQECFAEIQIPQSRPLSAGEVLGCTAPKLGQTDALVFVADGRFHLEAMMIANPEIKTYRYDPYNSKLVEEAYDHDAMHSQRREAIDTARKAQRWGIVLSSLGRQGNPSIVKKLEGLLKESQKKVIHFVMSEITPNKLAEIENVDAWVQVGCPRLSIDWGREFSKPVLTPYEAMLTFNQAPKFWEGEKSYPMDYYAKESGPWSSSYHKKQP